MAQQPPGRDSGSGAMKSAQPYIDAAWQLAGSMVVLTLAGVWLDRKFDTSPLWVLVGALLGIGAGMYSFLRRVMYLAEQDKKRRQDGPGPGK